MPSNNNELRCFCTRRPLLAVFGVDDKGRTYVHQRVYKQHRVYGESIAYGPVSIRCRECLRWHTVIIRQPGRAVLEETTDPIPSVLEA